MDLAKDGYLFWKAQPETLAPMVRDAENALVMRAPFDVVRAAVSTILAGYRTPDLLDPAAFAQMAAEALEDYPAVTVLRLAAPKTGILRTSKWPPAIAELVAWCEADLEPMKAAIGAACRQIERCKAAEAAAAEAIERAAEKARQQVEWEAGAPERERLAAEAAKIAKRAAEKHDLEAAIQARRNKARGTWFSQACAAVKDNAVATEALFRLLEDDALEIEATDQELDKPGTGATLLLTKIGFAE